MTDNEKLIEEAAKAIYEAQVEESTCGDLARAALAVFEKAHTPTDDERGALARAQWDTPVNVITWDELTEMAESGDGDYRETRDYALAAAGRGIAAGFRRSVVPEASTECTCANTLGWHAIDCPANRNLAPEAETSDAHAYSRGFWAGARSPQGEPSDALAAIDEALRLWNDGHGLYDSAWVARQAENMAQVLRHVRGALGAAGGVR